MGRTNDFGAILRTFREQLTPDAAGIRATPPVTRRVPGLRRGELAHLAGVSEEHLKRLEQGRRQPSPNAVDALARALHLNPADHNHLRQAAGFAAPPDPAPMPHRTTPAPHRAPNGDQVPHPIVPAARVEADGGRVRQEITPAARRILDRLTESPTCLCDAAWNVLAGNSLWLAFNCGAATADGRGRNMAWRVFTDAPTTVFRTPTSLAGFRATIVADLRAAVRRYPADPGLHDLIADLRAISPEFDRLWHAKTPPTAHTDHLTVRDPDLGEFALDKDVLTVEPGDLRVVVLTAPPNSPDANRLAAMNMSVN